MIRLDGISKTYGRSETAVRALEDISLDICQGEAIAVLGRSGSGKTTLLDIIGTLTRPTWGKYFLRDLEIPLFSDAKTAQLRGRAFGFVFQSFNLLPDRSVYQNIALAFKYRKNRGTDINHRVENALEHVRLDHKRDANIRNLSGGEQQRVAIARAIVTKPDIILADEPTGNLDTATGSAIISLLFRLWENGKTLIVVTHDLALAKQFPRIIFLTDGRVTYDGPAESFFIPHAP